jgi:putative transposase
LALGRPVPPLVLSEDEVQQLQPLASSRSLPHSIVQRAQIVLACGAGETNTAIAKRMGLTGMTVGKWRKRYRELGLEGLHDELRPGRPRTYEDDKVAAVINRALQTRPPDGSTHWSARTLAAARKVSAVFGLHVIAYHLIPLGNLLKPAMAAARATSCPEVYRGGCDEGAQTGQYHCNQEF